MTGTSCEVRSYFRPLIMSNALCADEVGQGTISGCAPSLLIFPSLSARHRECRMAESEPGLLVASSPRTYGAGCLWCAVTQPETVNFKDLSDALQERFPHLKIKDLPDEPSKPAVDSYRVRQPNLLTV